ncbi:MAG TPA: hypothetical protein PKW23_05180 [Dictyoglomaceae bacterium]|nr:hypothetical protein [Dictyoglomaceae bacterium]HOL38785.1 hypothetical protein [Dictyoglomaceae bacterium]HOP94511.1 hypothetical protein [Dictyoglomaceae bacterium]HPP15466.1 hypothetical protein [Dictyoglomaceae bacterium]HPU43244.1 hypothetical protein [Dictyoglomaceae bacterium]
MDLKSIFNDPKQRLILIIVIVILAAFIVGYYAITNYILVPQEEASVTTPHVESSIETYTFSQVISTLTQAESVFTYSPVVLGRSNPFLPVINLSPEKSTFVPSQVSSSGQISSSGKVTLDVSPKGVSETTKKWNDNFRLTGIIRGSDKNYAIIEEGERGYILREGERLREDIYLSKIESSSVILKKGKESVTLKLGGD